MSYDRDQLLAAYRRHRGPDEAATDRIHARLRHIDAPARSSRSVAGWVVAASLVAAAALAWWWSADVGTPEPVGRHTRPLAVDQLDSPMPMQAPVTVEPGATQGVPAPVPPPVRTPAAPALTPEPSKRTRSRDATSSSNLASPGGPSLVEETARIAAARRALRKGELAEAMRIIEGYRRDFPHPRLAEEADAIATMVACGRGEGDRQSAAAFTRRYPRSLFGDGVARACKKSR